MDGDTKSTADILRAAKAHISEPENWIREWFFEGEFDEGNLIPDNAPCCIYGATAWAARVRPGSPNEPVDEILIDATPGAKYACDVSAYNDHPDTTHADIMALFDRAIATAEATQ